MTLEDKKLLITDLCARLPYGIKCQVHDFPSPYTLSGIIPSKVYQELYFEEMDYKECNGLINIKYSKPYLFPLSSMTEEQKNEFNTKSLELQLKVIDDEIMYEEATQFEVDFYNKHHFDWRGLIEKGLALDASNLNIYNNDTGR